MGIGTKLGIVALAGNAFSNIYSLNFDGSDEYATIGDITALEFNRTDAFSISCWFKADASENAAIFTKADSGNDFAGWQLATLSSGGKNKISFRLRKTNSVKVRLDTTAIFNLNEWHHVITTYDGSGTNTGLKVYVNGTNQGGTRSGTLGSDLAENAFPVNIGVRNNSDFFFNGKIDEVAVFNSELSSENVTLIYNSGIPNDISDLSPLGWWRMGDKSTFDGTDYTLVDQGSGGNNATTVNIEQNDREKDIPS